MHTGSGSAGTARPQLGSPEGTSTVGGGCAAKTGHVFAIAVPANKVVDTEKMYSGDDSDRVEVVNVVGSSGKQHGDDVAKGDKAMDGDDSDGKGMADVQDGEGGGALRFWAECDRCKKWRHLDVMIQQEVIETEPWFCTMVRGITWCEFSKVCTTVKDTH